MTVTYDGSKITTDTLYEDGTIQVKKGFVIENEFSFLKPITIDDLKLRDTILNFSSYADTSVINKLTLDNITSTKSIKELTVEDDSSHLNQILLDSISIKNSIIIP